MKSHWIFIAASFAIPCAAQDFYWTAVSAQSLATGGVYIPSRTGVLDALAMNPAGLSTISAPTIDANIGAIFARGSFSNVSNSKVPLQTPPGVVPYGAFGTPIGHSRFTLAAGILPELLSVSDWHYVDAPGVAGASYGLQHQKSAITALRGVVGLGMQVTRVLSIGASFGVDYNSNQLTTPYVFQSQPTLAGLKTLLDLHTTGVGRNFSVGVIADPARRWKIGASWKSRTIIDSTGSATGNAYAQFAALGLQFRPDFAYSAAVRNVLPQSALVSVMWSMNSRWTLAFQTDWVDWKDAFVSLPVSLTNGTNADINSVLKSTSLVDGVPLYWKDQFAFRGGFERTVTESVSIRGGFAHTNSPVPDSTLSPLTAAIMTNQWTTGVGYRRSRARFDLSYGFDPTAKQQSGRSALKSGEYSNSTVRVGLQALTLGTSYSF